MRSTIKIGSIVSNNTIDSCLAIAHLGLNLAISVVRFFTSKINRRRTLLSLTNLKHTREVGGEIALHGRLDNF